MTVRHHILLVALSLVACPAMAAANDGDQMKKILDNGCKAVVAGDVEGMTAPFLKTDTLTMFDWNIPRSRNYAQLLKANRDFVASAPRDTYCEYLEIHPVILSRDSAYTWAILKAGGVSHDGTRSDFVIRSTDIWRKINGTWKIVHEHNSFPTDVATGKADLQSRP